MANYSFADVPLLKYKRSSFPLDHGVKTSMSMGKLYPIDIQEVLPGDTLKIRLSCVARLTSEFIRPIMDNIFLDVYHFFVPSRVLYDDFQAVFGQDSPNAWQTPEEAVVPVIGDSAPVSPKSVADYMGLPPNCNIGEVSVLPFRAFAKIYDGYFRDQNLIDPMNIQTGDTNDNEVFNSNPWGPDNYTGMLPNVAKFHDYFTSCLPSPQKGNPVSVSLGSSAPVTFSSAVGNTVFQNYSGTGYSGAPIMRVFNALDKGVGDFSGSNDFSSRSFQGGTVQPLSSNPTLFMSPNANSLGLSSNYSASFSTNGSEPIDDNSSSRDGNFGCVVGSGSGIDVVPGSSLGATNLMAYIPDLAGNVDLSHATPITVNDLRLAFQTQKLLERDARSGGRYVEYLKSHWGVSVSDYTMRGMEYLGGRRIPLNVIQVAQTSATSGSENLASLGAYSQTVGRTRATKSFVEHGYVFTVACIRQFHTYQQGVEKMWKRKQRLDFYDPVFANIGEQPVYTYQLFNSKLPPTQSPTPTVFGYQEAWADYRSRHNKVTGEMRSSAENTLDVWHLADVYENAPALNQQFIEETPDFLDRAITVDSDSQDQFILDFFFKTRAYRVMPVYSVPSLIDHN